MAAGSSAPELFTSVIGETETYTHTHFRYNLAVQPLIVQFDNSILIVRQ